MKNEQGYIALLTVLIISAVALALSLTVALLGIGEAQSSFALYKGTEKLAFVEGCMEDALEHIRVSETYTGGTLITPEGSCSIVATNTGSDWTVSVTNTTNTQYQRTIHVTASRSASLHLFSWEER